MKKTLLLFCALCALALNAATPRESFLQKQAFAEMQRVTGQIDVLQTTHDELAARVSRIEGGKGELGSLKNDIAGLKAEIESVRREMSRQRQEIVADLTKKMSEIMKGKADTTVASSSNSDCLTYTIQGGDTLSLIAQAFGTTVAQLCAINKIQPTKTLQIGQKILVPKK